MSQVEIMFDDLSGEKQKELLNAVGVDIPEDMNWDTFPVTICDFDDNADR